MSEIKLKPYHIDVINNIPAYSSAIPKRCTRKIKELMCEYGFDDDYTENINGDFCEGWNTARSIIENMLFDRYWRLKYQIPERTGRKNRMRLIDADKINFEEVFGGQSDFAKDLRKATQELIDTQPTAFDREKVIEELNSERNLMYREDGTLMGARTQISIDRAIEIVEKGGIELA